MTELEKFQRRMIRMVARLQVQEKKPEDELWEYLRKQTKSDCKQLWERMRTLTLKKLKRLLAAEDRQDNIPVIARMSLTDWLLYDCVLVHEKIDVIGMSLVAEGKTSEPRQIFELFSLVQRFDLEGLRGEDLARGWTAATVDYNSAGRQCSPMLLQRRWYQLKEATRNKFYAFWFSYRGNARLLVRALNDKPSRLQAAVAKRFPHIITKKFIKWEELIENKLIIMPNEFENQMKMQAGSLPKPLDDKEADLVLVEPEIETIDLRLESDSEKDDENDADNANNPREEVEDIKRNKMINDENIAAVNSIKEEPMEVDMYNVDEDHMKIIDIDINYIEGIEALENIDIPVEQSAEDDATENNTVAMECNEDDSRGSGEEQIAMSEEKENLETTGDEADVTCEVKDVAPSPTKSPAEDVLSLSDTEDKQEIEVPLLDSNVTTERTETEIDETEIIADVEPEIEPTDIPEINLTNDSDDNESITMPQIANVFGNVNMADDELNKLNDFVEPTESDLVAVPEENIDDEIEDDIITTMIPDDTCLEESVRNEIDDSQATTSKNNAGNENSEYRSNDSLYCDFIPDVTFEDDGIEFIDDGIAEEPDTTDTNDLDENKIKQEISGYEEKVTGESQSIDLKLLMVPVVYTKKLEHMDVLKDKPISHVDDKESIDIILAESKPVIKIQIEIKPEPVNKALSDNEEIAHDDLFEEPKVDDDSESDNDDVDSSLPDEERVNPSSVLFQKPRNRDYGPLVVCKNPDFNTRLKRLTIGFLSYARNRFYLRACKPLTIDLCKAFESKLVDNTIYLKKGSTGEVVVKKEKPDPSSENSQTAPIASNEKIVEVTTVPSTTSVQIDIDKMQESNNEQLRTPSITTPENESNKDVRQDDKDALMERNKVIVLPNIDNVRRINQKLLVAEVLPMRVETNSNVKQVPSVIQEEPFLVVTPQPPKETSKPAMSEEEPLSEETKTKKEITGGTVICSGQVIDGVTNVVKARNYRPLRVYTTWRPSDRARVGFWNQGPSKIIAEPNNIDDQLLTTDTLNKMLHIMLLKDPIKEINPLEKAKDKKYQKAKESFELQKKVNEVEDKLTGKQKSKGNGNSSGTMKKTITYSQTRRRWNKQRKLYELPVDGYGSYCCWVQFKQMHPDSYNSHPCRNKCRCCCGDAEVETEHDPAISKVCESIESVIEQSREIIETENFENEYLKNKVDNTSNDVIENNTKENSSENNINGTDTVENIIDKNNATKTNSDEKDATENKNVEANRDELEKAVSFFEKKPPAKRKTVKCKIVRNKNTKEKVSERNVVKKSIAIQTSVPTDDCMVIDSDDADAQSKLPPGAQVTFTYDKVPPKKRGRPRKCSTQIIVNAPPLFKDTPKQLIPYQHTPKPVTETSKQITKTSNLRQYKPLLRKKATQDIFLMNGNYISRKPNHPIFLGANKILLTDVILPRNKLNHPQNMPPAAVINTGLSLPPGVNLMLLPSGVLSCTVQPNIQLTPEQVTNLGALIENIQLQINSAISNAQGTIVPTIESAPAIPSSPTLQLIPGAVPTVVQNNEVINLTDDENEGEKAVGDNLANSVTESIEQTTVENTSSKPESMVNTSENDIPFPYKATLPSSSNVADTIETTINETTLESTVTTDPVISSDDNVTNPDTDNPGADRAKTDETSIETALESTVTMDPVISSDDNITNPDTDNQGADRAETDETSKETTLVSIATMDPVISNDNNVPNPDTEIQGADTDGTSINKTTLESTVIPDAVMSNDNKVTNADTENEPMETNNDSREPASEGKSTESEPTNKKTILSDLMEMSGICDEDIAPVAETIPPLQHITHNLSVPEATNLPLIPLTADVAGNTLPELSAITSLWELKYACINNGNFFKFDLETKSLYPINVCIKQKVQPAINKTNQFVDLTNDADDDVSKPTEPEKQLEDFDDLPVYIVKKTNNTAASTYSTMVAQDSGSHSRSLLKSSSNAEPAKPLKLFKVVHPFPNLQRGESGESSTLVSESPVIRRRKQILEDRSYETQYLNFIASDDAQENYEFEGSFEDAIMTVDDSDSSDDEPLAKKVRRREEMQKQAQEKAEAVATETETTTSEVKSAEVVADNTETANSELPMEVVEEDATPALQFMPCQNEDEEEEDCILGV